MKPRSPLFLLCFAVVLATAAALAAEGPAGAPVAVDTNSPAKPAPRPPRKLLEDEVRDLLANHLNQRMYGDGAEWELRVTRPWTPITVPDEPLSVEIVEPAIDRITSSAILRFELRAGRELVGSWQLPVQARLWREVLVAHAAQTRGLPLADASFVRERRDVLTLRNPVCELPANAGAYELAETVPAGTTLTARAVRLRPVVRRGQTADAILQDGAMMVSIKVEVLESGVPGQMIRVRNTQSRREFRGKVQDERTITVCL